MRVLYISYDGILEPLGQSQVLQYVLKLARDHQMTLISYEKPADLAKTIERAELAATIRRAGATWIALRYHKRPTAIATSYDLLVGFLVAAYIVVRRRTQIVHARSYVPALLALMMKGLFGTRFIFDMRGFWPDQRADCGEWSRESRIYRVTKRLERRFLTRADVVVSLTHAGVAAMRQIDYLRESPPRFEVISTCTNLDLFHPAEPTALADRPFTVGYVGSAGSYYLFDQMFECFAMLRDLRPDAHFVVVVPEKHEQMRERLTAAGVPPDRVEVKSTSYAGVPAEMRRMDAAIFLLRTPPSFKAVAPTKLGEFLATGIPCLANAGIGDLEDILEGDGVGVILHEYDAEAKRRAVARLVDLAHEPDIRQRSVAAAHRRFSLAKAVGAYDAIYRSLTGMTGVSARPDPVRSARP